MITKLVLKNWRSHEDSEFEFTKGTNVLVGPMGSGKSTAMDAISFALFGTFPNLNDRKLKLDDVIMNKPSVKNNASVEMTFMVNGEEYSIKRTIERGGGVTAELRKGEQFIEGPQTKRTTSRVSDILKMDYKLFSRAIYAEQNNIDYFLEIAKGKRKEKIDELLNIAKFEKSRKGLTTVINRLKDRTEEKRKFVVDEKGIEEIPKLDKEVEEKSKNLEKKTKELDKLAMENEKTQKEYNEMAGKKEKYDHIFGSIKENKGRVDFLKQKLEAYEYVKDTKKDVEKKIWELKDEKKEISEKSDERKELEKEIEKTKALIDKNSQNIAECNQKLEALKIDSNIEEKSEKIKKEIEKISKEIEDKTSSYKSLKIHLKHLDDNVEKLNLGTENCPVCESELPDQKRTELLSKRKNEKDESLKKIKEMEDEVVNLSNKRKEIEEELKKVSEEMKKVEEKKWILENQEKNRNEIDENKEVLHKFSEKLEAVDVGRSMEDVDNEIKKFEKVLEYFSYQEDLESTRSLLEELRKDQDKLGYEEKLEKYLYESLKEIEKNLSLRMQEVKSLKELLAEKQTRLETLKKMKAEIEEIKQEIEYLSKTVDSFEILQVVLQNAQIAIRHEFTNETNLALSDVWKKMYPYGDYSDLRLGIDDTGDYILQLQTRIGDWVNVEGVTSGGERSTACLALRIALSLVLAGNLSWLVLDEPTHNLDKTAIRELSRTMKDHLPEIVEQIFIITHEPELEKATSGYLYHLERNKEEDEPTRVVFERL